MCTTSVIFPIVGLYIQCHVHCCALQIFQEFGATNSSTPSSTSTCTGTSQGNANDSSETTETALADTISTADTANDASDHEACSDITDNEPLIPSPKTNCTEENFNSSYRMTGDELPI